MVNASQNVSVFCHAICGQIRWRINGEAVDNVSSYKGKYTIIGIYSVCSGSQDPKYCPTCGCDNCDSASLTQRFNSTLSLVANSSLIIDCVSEQKYSHHDYSILRKTFNIITSESACCRVHEVLV